MSQATTNYVVWVGGVQVNSRHLTEAQANDLADEYLNDGYDDVEVEVCCPEGRD
jgi:hypothetical protein